MKILGAIIGFIGIILCAASASVKLLGSPTLVTMGVMNAYIASLSVIVIGCFFILLSKK